MDLEMAEISNTKMKSHNIKIKKLINIINELFDYSYMWINSVSFVWDWWIKRRYSDHYIFPKHAYVFCVVER
jgi:hypothetical protein